MAGLLCCGWLIFEVFVRIIWENAIIFGDYEGNVDVCESRNADSLLGIGVSDLGIGVSALGITDSNQGNVVSGLGIVNS